MKSGSFIHVLTFCFVVSFSCEDKDEQTAPVSIEYQMLNGKGEPAVNFTHGENFVFNLQITNNSNQLIVLDQASVNTERFLEVYSADHKDAQGNPISFGKPFDHIFLIKVNGIGVHSGETLKMSIPWVAFPWEPGVPYYTGIFHVENAREMLPPGSYFTQFSTAFEFSSGDQEYVTEVLDFGISFTVD